MRLTSSIRKIDKNHYRLIVNFGFDKEAGKYRKSQRDVRGTKPEAEEVLRQWVEELKQGPSKYSTQPLGDYLIHWVDHVAKPDLEHNTYESYRRQIDTHIIPVIGHIPLCELEPSQIQDLYSFKAESGRLVGKSGLSNRSITYIHAILRRGLENARTLRLIPENPCDYVKPPRGKQTQREKMVVLSKEELAQFLVNTAGHRDHVLIYTAAYTGMRQSELLGLTWSDILWDKRLIDVHSAIHIHEDGTFEHRSRTKNVTSSRTVPISQALIDVLKAHQEAQLSGRKKPLTGLVFPDKDGKSPQNRKNLSKRFSILATKHGHDGMRFHDLRHCHATILLSDGVMVNVVSKRLGHSDPQTTLRIYAHVLPVYESDAAERFEALLAPQVRESSANKSKKTGFRGFIPIKGGTRKRSSTNDESRHR